ncbi:MAG TPA: hypothetical protein VGH99_17170 [Pseudonocardia sp.]|jgi:signal transduction histidine kinase
MTRWAAAGLVRLLVTAVLVGSVFVLFAVRLPDLLGPSETLPLLPFAAALVAVALLLALRDPVDRAVRPLTGEAAPTPYSALVETAARARAGELSGALPALARVVGEGTGADRAVVWLAVEDSLVGAAVYPTPTEGPDEPSVANLAVLLARPDTDYVVPVLDGATLRAVLAIGKPGRSITPADQRLVADVAHGAGLLLRGVALNAELEQRVYRAAELAGQLASSRERLTSARDVERRRLATELTTATTGRLAALRAELVGVGEQLDSGEREDAVEVLRGCGDDLDELLERFRVIARGVYPSVLRDQGPVSALEELVADLPRTVVVSGDLGQRLTWEVESGVYYLAAAAVRRLAEHPGGPPVRVRLAHTDGLLSVTVTDPSPPTDAGDLLEQLADDAERLSAVGGDLRTTEEDGGLTLHAWLPDQLAPAVATGPAMSRAGRP